MKSGSKTVHLVLGWSTVKNTNVKPVAPCLRKWIWNGLFWESHRIWKLYSSAICIWLGLRCTKHNNAGTQASDFMSLQNWQVRVYSQQAGWQSEADIGANDGPLVYLQPVGAPPLGRAGSGWTRTCFHTDLRVAAEHRSKILIRITFREILYIIQIKVIWLSFCADSFCLGFNRL